MILIAEAASDEHGNLRDGVPGDQKQKRGDPPQNEEVRIRELCEPFEWVLRCPDKGKATLIAEDARKIAENVNVGYAQYGDAPYGDRYGLWNLIHEAGGHVDFSKITTPCNTDCSQLADCCLYNNGYVVTKWINSIKIKDVLTAIGFTAIPFSQGVLEKGDILARFGHVAVCIQVSEGEEEMYSAVLMSSTKEKLWATGAGPKTRSTPYVTVKRSAIGFEPNVIVVQQKGEILANSQWVRGQAHIYCANFQNDATAGVAVGKYSGYFNPDASEIVIPVRFPGKEYLVKIYQ